MLPQWGDTDEYPQHMFLMRNKQNYPLIIIKYPTPEQDEQRTFSKHEQRTFSKQDKNILLVQV